MILKVQLEGVINKFFGRPSFGLGLLLAAGDAEEGWSEEQWQCAAAGGLVRQQITIVHCVHLEEY